MSTNRLPVERPAGRICLDLQNAGQQIDEGVTRASMASATRVSRHGDIALPSPARNTQGYGRNLPPRSLLAQAANPTRTTIRAALEYLDLLYQYGRPPDIAVQAPDTGSLKEDSRFEGSDSVQDQG